MFCIYIYFAWVYKELVLVKFIVFIYFAWCVNYLSVKVVYNGRDLFMKVLSNRLHARVPYLTVTTFQHFPFHDVHCTTTCRPVEEKFTSLYYTAVFFLTCITLISMWSHQVTISIWEPGATCILIKGKQLCIVLL